ncbi:hypothetical protein [Pseudomonas sp. IT-P12]|uniref:hypothetical protein n=1 Tax=Pseudomonas sp. IT-P12 TaxID=3026450 RepID=UPI0039E05FC2
MSNISSVSSVGFQAVIASPVKSTSFEPTSQASMNSGEDNPSTRVEISAEGKKKADEDKYADIEKTSLPDDVKEALKNIRKLQERIAAKRQEIQKIMEDDSLSDEIKKSRRGAALAELQVMESAMSDAMNALNTRMSSHNLNAEDRDLAKGLVGMK